MEREKIHMTKENNEMICFKLLLLSSCLFHVLAVHLIKHPVMKL